MRSLHPFHSISSIGKYAKKISTSHGISEFSEGSFFDCLLKLNTKVLFIGVSFVETLAHLAEERACVPYRSWITVSGKIKKNDSVEEVAQKFYARKLKPIEYHINIPKIYDFLKSRSIIKITDLGSGTASICNSNEMVDALTQKMEESPYFFTTNNAI
jgi:aminoglycoside N3'-acetyltransferase